jgi:predicted small secreted protein
MRKSAKVISVIAILAITVVGCTTTQGVQGKEQQQQYNNQEKLAETQPAPNVDFSVGRQNLIDRMNRMNDKNLVGYIYLLSDTGQVITSYVTKGRVTSMQQYLTSYDMLVDYKGRLCGTPEAYSGVCYAVESPDFDGTYGYHPEGIFFFTDTGAMVEWTGKYVWTDQPLSIKTPVSLTRQVK